MLGAEEERLDSREGVCKRLSVEFHEVKDIPSEEFKEAMNIYISSFPENERYPVAKIEASLKSGRSRLIIGRMDDRVVLMALLYPLKGTPFVLWSYLAVAEEYRGRGIGEHFMRNIFSIMDDLQFNYLLGEIENPYLDGDRLKSRRVNFFKKCGMKELKGVRYLHPPLQGTTSIEMILMVLSRMDENHLEGGLVKNILIQIFREAYGRSDDDELLTSILRGIPDLIRLV